jgi:hypothetical protein
VAFLDEPLYVLAISFHFIEGSNYENSLFSPIPQVTNSRLQNKKEKTR